MGLHKSTLTFLYPLAPCRMIVAAQMRLRSNHPNEASSDCRALPMADDGLYGEWKCLYSDSTSAYNSRKTQASQRTSSSSPSSIGLFVPLALLSSVLAIVFVGSDSEDALGSRGISSRISPRGVKSSSFIPPLASIILLLLAPCCVAGG